MQNRKSHTSRLAQTSANPPGLDVERAEGVRFYGAGGKSWIDMISGVCVSNLGHCHPRVIKAIKDQAEKYLHLMVYGEFLLEPQAALADYLAAMMPASLGTMYPVNSGSEAVEGALKLARRFTGRKGIVSFRDCYHGGTMGAMSLMAGSHMSKAFEPLVPGVKQIRFNEETDLAKITEDDACVIAEPVQGEAGIRLPSPGYLQGLRKRCDETGALLVFDEVQTGAGRTGELFAFMKYGVVPDILVTAKGFGSGMPLGAFIASEEIMACLASDPPLAHITTFGGHPLSCAAALEGLKVMNETGLLKTVASKERLIRSLLQHELIKECRSSGLLMGFDLKPAGESSASANCMKLIGLCMEKGVILDWFLFSPGTFRVAPPLIIIEDEIREACKIIISCLDEMS